MHEYQPLNKVARWEPPHAGMMAFGLATPPHLERASLSTRLLPEYLTHPALDDFFSSAKGRVLVAEGDSWFDYPVPLSIDLIDELNNLGRNVVSIAYRGDTLENMIYGTMGEDGISSGSDLDHLKKMIAKLTPKAALFSGGGNDVAGSEFAGFLNHALSGRDSLRTAYLEYFVNDYVRHMYEHAAKEVWSVDPNVKFITHGYAHALPSGLGVGNLFGLIRLVGPWLKPSLDAKGYSYAKGVAIVRTILDQFNTMLDGLAHKYENFVYVDFRPHVGESYDDWTNELHLTNDGIRKAAKILNDRITDEVGA